MNQPLIKTEKGIGCPYHPTPDGQPFPTTICPDCREYNRKEWEAQMKPTTQTDWEKMILEAVDEIAEITLEREGVYVVGKSDEWKPEGDTEVAGVIRSLLSHQATEILEQVEREVIGKDEPSRQEKIHPVAIASRNVFRSEQRQALTKLKERHS